MGKPAARITDLTAHGTPLTPGPGSLNVLIGFLPAWRGIPLAAAAGLKAAQSAADATVKAAETATKAAAGTPGAPAAYAAEQAAKAAALASMSSMMSSFAGSSDIHVCPIPTPVPPHGPGVVIDGSSTVLINNMPACTMGCTVLEALGGPDKIVKGEMTVLIGDSGGGGGSGGGGMAALPPPGLFERIIEWIRETLSPTLTPRERALALIDVRGHADQADAELVAAELAKLPPHILARLEENGTRVVVGRGAVTDAYPALAGVVPRGWPPGSSWDTVPGAFMPDSNEIAIATVGHGTPAGPHVPVTGEGHGSSNLVVHETMHGVDHTGDPPLSEGADFNTARTADSAGLSAYENQAGSAGQEETFAESAARYYGGDQGDAAAHPNLNNYWASDPLNPANQP